MKQREKLFSFRLLLHLCPLNWFDSDENIYFWFTYDSTKMASHFLFPYSYGISMQSVQLYARDSFFMFFVLYEKNDFLHEWANITIGHIKMIWGKYVYKINGMMKFVYLLGLHTPYNAKNQPTNQMKKEKN